MKMVELMKRKAAVTLLIFICVSFCGIFAASAAEMPAENTEENIRLLKGLGIITPERYDEYDAEKNMSRLEFTGVLAKIFNLAEKTDEQIFTDVPLGTENAGYIGMAYQLGIFRGDGNGKFRPYDAITYVEMVKSILYAAGYGEQIEESGGIWNNALSRAAAKELDGGVGYAHNQEMKRIDAAHVLANALDMQVIYSTGSFSFEDGKLSGELAKDKEHTVLTYFMNMRKIHGIVTGNAYTALDNSLGAPGAENQIRIDGEIYNCEDGEDLLGMYVTAYVGAEESTKRNVSYITPHARNRTLTLKKGEFSYKDEVLYSEEGRERKKVRIAEGASVIFNENFVGKTGTEYVKDEQFSIQSGNLLLIDNDDNGIYEVCRITEFENAYIVETDLPNGVVVDAYQQKAIYFRDGDCKYEYYADGKEVSIEKITKNTVISMAKSPDGKLCRVYISNSGVNGTVSEKNQDNGIEYVKIGEKEYPVSSYYIRLQNTGNPVSVPLNLNTSGRFLLTHEGEIAAYLNVSEKNYGYITAIRNSRGSLGESEAGVKMYTENGRFEAFDFAERTYVTENGETRKCSPAQAAEMLSKYQVIRYQLNAEQKINRMEIAVFKESGDNKNFTQNSSKMSLQCQSNVLGAQYSILGSTVIFRVPDPDICSESTLNDEMNYTMGGSFSNGSSYTAAVYDLDEYQTAGLVVQYLGEGGRVPGGGYSTPMVVTEVSNTIYNDENCLEISGFAAGTPKSFYTTDFDQPAHMATDRWSVWNVPGFTVSDIRIGDVIQYTTKSGGYLDQYRMLFRPNAQKEPFELYSEGEKVPANAQRADMYTAFGEVVSVNDNQFCYSTNSGVNKVVQFASWSNTYLVDMDGERPEVKISSKADVHTGDRVFILINYSNLYQTVIYRWE